MANKILLLIPMAASMFLSAQVAFSADDACQEDEYCKD